MAASGSGGGDGVPTLPLSTLQNPKVSSLHFIELRYYLTNIYFTRLARRSSARVCACAHACACVSVRVTGIVRVCPLMSLESVPVAPLFTLSLSHIEDSNNGMEEIEGEFSFDF